MPAQALSRPLSFALRSLRAGLIAASATAAVGGSSGLALPGTGFVSTAEAAALSAADRQVYTNAFLAVDTEQWSKALSWAEQAKSPVLVDVITAQMLASPRTAPSFDTLRTFIEDHPDWPDLGTLRLKAEGALTGQESSKQVISWFSSTAPRSGHGKLIYALALLNQGQTQQAVSVARDAWHTESLSNSDEKRLFEAFGNHFSKSDHQRRADLALWEGRISDARDLQDKVGADYKALILARITLQGGKGNPDAQIKKVPQSLSGDPGLLFDRMQWRRKKDLDDLAASLLKHANADKGSPERWGKERLILSRTMLERGLISQAYDIARKHRLKSGATYADLEWMAGWIALRHLKDPKAALVHFRAFEGAVSTTISVGRGAYWHGRAAEALGLAEQARTAYRKAADEGTTFYGQLAMEKLRMPMTLPASPAPTADDRTAFAKNPLVKIVQALGEIDRSRELLRFGIRLVEDAPTPGQRALALALGRDSGGVDVGVALSRRAAQKGHIDLSVAYPLPDFSLPNTPETALTLAIIRQESNFSTNAVSRVGAKGLMQLMPGTAKGVASKLGVGYQEVSLTAEPQYNVKLGSSYLSGLVERFDGSYALAIAGYNAGPGRPSRWVKDFGDPRTRDVDMIDWIESIPFSETRNYVQRVLEGVQVYRYRLGHGERSLRLNKDLQFQ